MLKIPHHVLYLFHSKFQIQDIQSHCANVITVVSPHQLKYTILHGSCVAHCLFQSLAALNLIYFQNHGILNVFYHVLDRIKGLGNAMLANKA